jgi:hypothetical protein
MNYYIIIFTTLAIIIININNKIRLFSSPLIREKLNGDNTLCTVVPHCELDVPESAWWFTPADDSSPVILSVGIRSLWSAVDIQLTRSHVDSSGNHILKNNPLIMNSAYCFEG